MGLQQVWLFDESDLDLERGAERCQSGECDEVRDRHRQPRCGGEHRGEDGVACPSERSDGDEVGALGGVDADPPRLAHRPLGDDGEHDAEDGHGDSRHMEPGAVEH